MRRARSGVTAPGGGRIAEPGCIGPSHTVLLLVDFINLLDFDGAEQMATTAVAAARAALRLRQRSTRERVQVIYANDNYGRWNDDFDKLWRSCVRRGGAAAEMARALQPRRSDIRLLKPRHSAFYATPLALLLRQLDCKRLIVAGLATNSCVLFTAMDAYLRGYSLWVPADCSTAETEDAHRLALVQIGSVLKADTRPCLTPRRGRHPCRAGESR